MERTLELFVSARGEDIDLPRVRAKIALPQEGGPIRVRLYPIPKPRTAFQMPFAWSLAGDIKDMGGTIVEHVAAPSVYTTNVANRVWDTETTDVTVNARADEVRTTRPLRRSTGEEKKKERRIVFRLSPGPTLNPVQTVMYDSTGNVRVRTSHRKSVLLGPERLRFDREYEGIGAARTSRLVGQVTSERSADDLLPLVEDVLLLASVGMRYRIVCLGWVQRDDRAVETCYRGNVRVPRQDEWDVNQSLIPIEHIPAFLARAYGSLKKSRQAALLRQALWRTVPVRREPVDRRIARLYAVVESLVLLASRATKRECILPNARFRKLRAKVKDLLAKEVGVKATRDLIIEKLPELNRPTFAHALARACRAKRVPLDELWPLTDTSGGVSITQLRNKFIHGDHVPYHGGLDIAADHLQWIAERLLLATLGWDRNKSTVNTGYLRQFIAYGTWQQEREHLTRLLRGEPETEE